MRALTYAGPDQIEWREVPDAEVRGDREAVVRPLAVASAWDSGVDGGRTGGPPLEREPGAPVLVVGGAGPGSIGLYAAACAVALGSERVVYVDRDERRLEIARAVGAEAERHDPLPEQLRPVPLPPRPRPPSPRRF